MAATEQYAGVVLVDIVGNPRDRCRYCPAAGTYNLHSLGFRWPVCRRHLLAALDQLAKPLREVLAEAG